MSLERKDVRAKLDPEVHEALTILCEVDAVDIGEFIERELVRVIRQRLHDASVLAARTSHLGISGKATVKRGSP